MLDLRRLWQGVRDTPTWIWGALGAAGSMAWMYLRMRSAEHDQLAAETKATEAVLDRDTAETGARAEVALERAAELGEERASIHAQTERDAGAAEASSDAEVEAWVVGDAARRQKGDPP